MTNGIQGDLFARRRREGPTVMEDDVEDFVRILRGKGWRSADWLSRCFDWDARYLRAMRRHSKGRVISGQKGYRLTNEATPDEVRTFIDRMRSQAKDMIEASVEVEKHYHTEIYNRQQESSCAG